jgi:MOSC domain-containing protein YiiM
MHTYPVTLHHICVSPGHNYFGRPKDGPGTHVTRDVDEVEAVAGMGLLGDRYFGVDAHYNAQVTLVAWEVFAALQAEFGRPEWSPIRMRRNIVIEGVPLNQLIGREFTLDFGSHQVDFAGAQHCAPCAWMDAALAPGALKFLHGRGGLRARILTDGALRKGKAALQTATPLDLTQLLAPVARPKLPG